MQIASNTPLSEIAQYGTPEQLFEHRLAILEAVTNMGEVEEIMGDACIQTIAGIDTYINTHSNLDEEYEALEKRVEELETAVSDLSSDNDYLKEQIEEYRERLAEVEVE